MQYGIYQGGKKAANDVDYPPEQEDNKGQWGQSYHTPYKGGAEKSLYSLEEMDFHDLCVIFNTKLTEI